MSFVVLGTALAMLVGPGLGRSLARRLQPRLWVRASTASVIGGFVFLEMALVLIAGPTVLRWMNLAQLAEVCERVAGHIVLGEQVGAATATLALGLPVVFTGKYLSVTRAHRRIRFDLALGADAGSEDGIPVVELPMNRYIAMAVPGKPGSVVVSSAVSGVLSAAERETVIRHEVAHLRHGHWRLSALAVALATTFRWVPFVGRSAASIRLGLERVADEDAIGSVPSRRHAIRQALVKLSATPAPGPALSFARVDLVVERLRALENPVSFSPFAGLVTRFSVIGMVTVAGVAMVYWLVHAHHVDVVLALCRLA